MKTIYKYKLEPNKNDKHESSISIHDSYELLTFGYDGNGDLCLWAIVNTDNDKVICKFFIVLTGEPFPSIQFYRYIKTVINKQYVGHIFQVIQ